MKKNFMQRNMIWISLLLICFLVIPSFRDSYCVEDKVTEQQFAKTLVHEKQEEPEKVKVVIDPGHGGYDSGSESDFNGVLEKDITLRIAKQVGKLLAEENIEVIYTRTSDDVDWSNDNVEDLNARTKIANQSGAACFVSIHLNYADYDQDVISGNEVWVNVDNRENVILANTIDKELAKVKGSESRGVKDQSISPLSLLVFNKIPSVLIETGFLSNEEDTAFVNSKAGSRALAEAIANGILTYVNK